MREAISGDEWQQEAKERRLGRGGEGGLAEGVAIIKWQSSGNPAAIQWQLSGNQVAIKRTCRGRHGAPSRQRRRSGRDYVAASLKRDSGLGEPLPCYDAAYGAAARSLSGRR